MNNATLKYYCRPDYSWDWQWFFTRVWNRNYAILSTYIPATLLVVLNALIVYKIVATRRAMQTSRALNDASASNNKVAAVTVMLLAECATFLLFNAPFDLIQTIYGFTQVCTKLGELDRYSALLTHASNALNFVMYMLTGRKFRKAFADTICRRPVNAFV
jgi:hypothetical protein